MVAATIYLSFEELSDEIFQQFSSNIILSSFSVYILKGEIP
jgi:hypothetical protein